MTRIIKSVYSDGGIIGPNPSLLGGSWAWCHTDEHGERVTCASGLVRPFLRRGGVLLPVTNNHTEMIALTRALLALPEGWSGRVYCDSKLALGWTFWGYKHEKVPQCLYDRMRHAMSRLGRPTAVLLDGHPTDEHLATGKGKRGQPVSVHNRFCDYECGRQISLYRAAQTAQAQPSDVQAR